MERVMLDLDHLEAFYERTDTRRGRAIVALIAEARAAREVVAVLRPVRAQVKHLLDDGTVKPAVAVQALRGVHTDLDIAIHAYDDVTAELR